MESKSNQWIILLIIILGVARICYAYCFWKDYKKKKEIKKQERLNAIKTN